MVPQYEVSKSQGRVEHFLANTVYLNDSFLSRQDAIATGATLAVSGALLAPSAIEAVIPQITHSETAQPKNSTHISGETLAADIGIGLLAGAAVYVAITKMAIRRLGRETFKKLRD